MKVRNVRSWAALGLLVFLGCYLAVQAAEVKIKVVVENASIRSKPGIDGSIMEEKIPLGAVYLSSKKEGEWYEVKFRSKLGVQLTGYIHEMYIEVVKEGEEQAAAAKQPPVFKDLGPAREKGMKNFEFGLFFGLSTGSFLPASSSYSDNWSFQELESVTETDTITHKLNNSPAMAGGFFTLYFQGGFGLRLSFDYNFKQTLSAAESAFNMSWTWTQGRGTFSLDKTWPVQGDFSLFPLSLNLIYKLQTGGALVPYFTGGLTYFMGKANLSTSVGYGESWLSADQTTQYIDYFIIPVKMEKKLDGMGGNFGAGFDVLLSPNIGLNIDAVYYFGPSFVEPWPFVAGSYPAATFTGTTLELLGQGATTLQSKYSKLNFKLSYFRIAGGLKILF
jgi:opacity protein-like surface antigen